MRTYVFTFKGVQPTGAAIAVVSAPSQSIARDIAERRVAAAGCDTSTLELKGVSTQFVDSVIYFNNGDY